MFRGLSLVNLDAKGRFVIPSRYRDNISSLSNGVIVLTIDINSPCLLMYALKEWEVIENRIQELPSLEPSVRRLQRLLIGHATEIDIDSTGRILIPSVLRDYARFQKNINLVGQGNKFEIWSEQLWTEYRDKWLDDSSKDSEEVNEVLGRLSI
ncbi:MAG: division/cell wall cluster transcriptional repressor MraZ [Legionellales bacterium]|nr:division/cell wall cluster transcriptional repressor MraZ [Legionellales bacterium]